MKKKIALLFTTLLLAACMLCSCALAPETGFSRGKCEDGVYQNKRASLSFRLPDEWTFSDDTDLASRMHIKEADELGTPGEPFNERMLALPSVYDMIAINKNGTVVMVVLENLSMIPDGLNMTEDNYLSILKDTFGKMGEDFTFGEVTDAKIGGNTYKMADMDISIAKQQYYVRKVGGYMVVISARTYGEDDLSGIIANFS